MTYPQVEQSQKECDELSHELRKREQEVERAHHDKIIELEKVHYYQSTSTRVNICLFAACVVSVEVSSANLRAGTTA